VSCSDNAKTARRSQKLFSVPSTLAPVRPRGQLRHCLLPV
jgi:hypothetical protein